MAVTPHGLSLTLPGLPRRSGLADCHADSEQTACRDFLRWRHEQPVCEDFGQVMSHCREGLRALLDPAAMPTDEARAARIEGLATAALLHDGLMDARQRLKAGQPPLLPRAELERFMVSEQQIRDGEVDFAWRRFVEAHVQRLFALLQAAAPLGRGWLGGMKYRLAIVLLEKRLNALKRSPEIAFADRLPTLKPLDWAPILWRVIKTH